jgi:3-deoxy-manno-octulosonate cytidylyltransferase (CMP-KDO synthetase)
MKKTIGVIPARYASTRFPAKPLHLIAGRPLLEWVLRGAKEAKSLQELVVATDHQEIANLATKLGVRAVMTDSNLPSGSDRVWAASQGIDCEAVVNIQGDEPLLKGELIDRLVEGFWQSEAEMATLLKALEPEDLNNPNVVKAVVNRKNEAIYFSRLPIPYTRMKPGSKIEACWQHLGLYVYKKSFLKLFCETAPAVLEQAESLEQLRALWLGAKIQTIIVDYKCMGVDTPEDVLKVEPFLRGK